MRSRKRKNVAATPLNIVFLRFLFSITITVLVGLKHIGDGIRAAAHFLYLISIKRPLDDIRIRYFLAGALLVAAISTFFHLRSVIHNLPNPKYLAGRNLAVTTKLYDRNDHLLYELYNEENRTPLPLQQIPKTIKDATIATEDKNFYLHKGFSITGVVRALWHNLVSGNQEGGSTITQQLIRSVYLSPEKTVIRKLKELILSVWAEHYYQKDELLEMYLNQVPYGGTAWGIEAAAQTYLGKSAQDVTLAEAALLAGLPAAPTTYSPYTSDTRLAKGRQLHVLSRMVANQFITQEQADDAAKETVYLRPAATSIAAPHFVMYVKQILEQSYGPAFVTTAGLRVKTTLDVEIQTAMQHIVTDHIDRLRELSVGNGALLVTDPKTGEILAMVGSRDYFDREHEGNVNVTTSLRQPGSSIKVITYAAALQNGFTAASIIGDIPVSYTVAGQPVYRPVNYDGRFHGPVSLRVAFGSSYNIPAVKTLNAIGLSTMTDQGKKMGVVSWGDSSRYGLSLTLGGGEVTMVEMATVYGTVANEGLRRDLTPFLSIHDYRNETLSIPNTQVAVQAMPPAVAFILSDILSDNAARTSAFGSHSSLVIPDKTVAVKTGTSDNKRDNWTIGYTPDFVVTVWVGNNDNTPMHPQLTSGITGAAPIWHDAMEELLNDREDVPFQRPDGVVAIPCYGRTEYFLFGTQPKYGCPTPVPPSPTNRPD